MLGIHHPFSKALYEREDDEAGTIKVTDGDKVGIFTSEGEWISGDLKFCDPQLCGWVAGPIMANHRMSKAATDQ